MSYRKNGRNKAYENLKANPDVKKHMLEACIIADKEDSLGENADELGIRRNEKMNNKEYSALFKKVIVASLSLIATGGIIAGVVSYSKNGGNKERLAAKETTSEYESMEKETGETLKNTEKITLKNDDEHSVEILEANQSIDGYAQKGDLVDLRMFKATRNEIKAWINDGNVDLDEIKKQFDYTIFENLEVLDVKEFRRAESDGSFSDNRLLTLKVTKEQKEEIEKNIEKYGSQSYSIKLKPR